MLVSLASRSIDGYRPFVQETCCWDGGLGVGRGGWVMSAVDEAEGGCACECSVLTFGSFADPRVELQAICRGWTPCVVLHSLENMSLIDL